MDYKYKATVSAHGKEVFEMQSDDLEKIKDETWEQITAHGLKDCVESKLRAVMRPSVFESDGVILRVNFSIR